MCIRDSSILLVITILLQQRGSGLGGAFGGDNFSAAFHKRRGAELFLFKLSIGLAILFAASAFLGLLAQYQTWCLTRCQTKIEMSHTSACVPTPLVLL